MKKITKKISSYFTNKINLYGRNFKGVDWNSKKSQYQRFAILSKIISLNKGSVNDIGCGYGEYSKYLLKKFKKIDYIGYDLSKNMINNAIKINPRAKFINISNLKEILEADFSIMSGVFNIKLKFSNAEWRKYILRSLEIVNSKSRIGFSFNLIKKFNLKLKKKNNNLYYANADFFYNYCKKNFSKKVYLEDTYGLHEFTIFVKK